MVRQLAEGVYCQNEYSGGNVGLVVTKKGALLIDAPMLPPDARHWRAYLSQEGIGSIYGLVNTDYHPEHLLGNSALAPARVFGHTLSLKPIAKYGTTALEQFSHQYRDASPSLAEEIMRITITEPEIMVGDRLTLYLGDREIEVLYLEGHTPASLGVYLPEERILFAGDNIANNEHPVMSQSSSQAWLETLARIDAMEVDLIVPGAGEPCGKEVIQPMYDYITEVRERTGELYDQGASRRECVDKINMLDRFPVPDASLARIKRRCRENVEQVYTEYRTVARRQRLKDRRTRRSP